MKKASLIFGILAALVVGAGLYFLIWLNTTPVEEGTVSLYIYPGDHGNTIAERVDSLGVFPSGTQFKLISKLTGLDKKLQVGRYDFTPEDSRYDIYRELRAGKSESVKITVPEGLTLERILAILADSMKYDITEFDSLAADTAFIHSLGIEANSLEGYLFPETYHIPWGAPATFVISTMVETLHSFVNDSLRTRMNEIGFNLHELLTFASLVEAEAGVGEERKTISSVYHNRLDISMLLQCDPTVIYALGGLDRRLLYKDLEIDSPYNTYRYSGLPPGPICAPGAASIIAALYPEETEYLYFVADGTGRHIFTRTLSEHNRAKRKVRVQRGD